MSFMKTLNKRGPKIEPCGTPRSTISQSLLMSLILTLWYLLCRELASNLHEERSTPYACNLAMSKPCGKLSKSVLKSIATVPMMLPLSNSDFTSSIIRNREVWQLYLCLKPDKNLKIIWSKKVHNWFPKTLSKTLEIAVCWLDYSFLWTVYQVFFK